MRERGGGFAVPRERSPSRDKAYEMWVQCDKKLELKRIAEELGVSAEQVRKWKNEDKWSSKTNSNVTNQNTKMNSNVTKRKGAPKGNKNNFKHGIYEKLIFDSYTEEEKEFAKELDINEELEIKMELRQCDIHIARIMKRMKITQDIDLILKYEDSIQKFRRQKMKCLEVLLQLGHNNAKLDLEILKAEATILTPEEKNTDDSNLIKALNETTQGAWHK